MFNNSYLKIINSLDLGFAVYDKQGKPIHYNSVFPALLELKPENLEKVSICDHIGISESIEQLYSSCKEKGQITLNSEWLNKRNISLQGFYMSEMDQIALVFKNNLKKEHQKIDETIKSPSECNLIEEASDSFFVINNELTIIKVNLSACKLTGYQRDELIGKSLNSLFTKEDLRNKPFETNEIESGKIAIAERKISTKNGVLINVEMRTKKLSDGNILSIIRDITSRILIRTQLENKNEELEHAYDQVIESEKKYKQLFKNIPLGIFTASADGNIESINIQMAEMLSSDSAERSKKFNLFELPTLKGSHFIEDFKSAISDGISHHKIYDYTSVWNKKTSLKSHILPLENEEGKKALVIVEDYTLEREKENRLRILSQGVNNSPASIVVTDAQGKIKFVNKSFLNITGYSMNELIDNTPSILKSGFHSEQFYKGLWSTILNGKEWIGEFRNKKKSGELFWESAMISALKDEKGRITNFMAIKEDITHKKMVEKELKNKTDQLLNLVTNTPDNICFKEADGKWILANKATIDFFGLDGISYQEKSNEELAKYSGKNSEFLMQDSKTDAEVWKTGHMLKYETHGTDALGDTIILEILKLPLFHSDGTKKGIINIGRDITKRKNYEKELEIAKERAEEADTLKSAFLANMSHEIRTPLNAIMGFSGLMADYSLDKESIQRFVEIIQVNGKQLLTIIDDILLISKLQVNQIKVQTAVFDLDQVLGKLYQQYARELDIQKEKKIELSIIKNIPSSVKIKTDRDKLQIIFSKLIRNAIKFTSEGKIEFGFDLGPKKELLFFVKDSGVGISLEKQQLIFQKFRQVDDSTTREYGGTGLGLSIVQGLIELLNGKIWLESEIDKGSDFYFTIPLESIEIEKLKVEEKISGTNWSNKKVLIVDDVPESIFLLSELLKRTQIKITSASNGIEAIDKIAEDPGIDIVLMDIQLPEMSGLDAAERIKKIKPGIVIIIQTAFSQDGYEQKSKEAGCDDIVYKPINFDILIKKMNRFL